MKILFSMTFIPLFFLKISHSTSIVDSENMIDTKTRSKDIQVNESSDDVVFISEAVKSVESIPWGSHKSSVSKNTIEIPEAVSQVRKRVSRKHIIKKNKFTCKDFLTQMSHKEREMLATYEAGIKDMFENIRKIIVKKTFFTFKYLFTQEITDFPLENTISFMIVKEAILLENIYRFFLLQNHSEQPTNSYLFYNENPIDPLNESLFRYIFENFICLTNNELERILSNSTPQHELKILKKTIIDFEIEPLVYMIKNYHVFYVTDLEHFYTFEFLECWRRSILDILEKKNSYIYLILPEFISFEIDLKEKINSIRLAYGTYFLAIFKLKLLINDPSINIIQNRFIQYEKDHYTSNSTNNEDYKWFLNQKRILRRKFMKILKIFCISTEHNILYSMLFTIEKIIYCIFVPDKSCFNRYHTLNIITYVLFLIENEDVGTIIIAINHFVENDLQIDLAGTCIISHDYIIKNLSFSVKKKIMVSYIRILKYLLDQKKDNTLTPFQLKDKQYISLQIKIIEEYLNSNETVLNLRNINGVNAKTFEIDELLLLASCLIQRIFKNSFKMKCFINLKNYFQRFLKA